jgi:glycosyltransferase involved in cell wall biosynthesis
MSREHIPRQSSLRIGYILLHFPALTETFVTEEIRAIKIADSKVDIISLLARNPGVIQPHSLELLKDTWYAPGFAAPKLWAAQLYFVMKAPFLYLRILITLLRQPCHTRPLASLAKRIAIFLKAVAAARHLEKRRPDILHAHFAWLSGAAAWIIARLIRLSYTVTVHAYDLFVSNDLLSLVCGQAQQVIAISEFNRREIDRLKACAVEKISVIHCGIDLGQFPLPLPRATLDKPSDHLGILSVGSLLGKKGHRYLISACDHLRTKGVNFACTIIGGGPDEQALLRQIREYGLQDRIRLMGPRTQPEIIAEYQRHDIFVLASVIAPNGDMDGIPVVLMEAGAMGLPLVSTRISGIPELVQQGYSGLLVDPEDPPALADVLASLAADPALRAKLGRNARALVETSFEIGRNTQALRAVLMEIAPLRRQRPDVIL